MFEVPGEMRLAILRELIRSIERGECEQLAEAGLSQTTQQRLHGLTARQVGDLAQMPYLQFKVDFDFSRLSFAIDTLLDVHERQSKLDYLVTYGASFAQIQNLFGLSRKEVETRRAALSSTYAGRGRPTLPTHKIREQIAAAWSDIANSDADGSDGAEPDDAARYIRLHEQFPSVSIAALETVVLSYAFGVSAKCR
jgi:hypothetical protein